MLNIEVPEQKDVANDLITWKCVKRRQGDCKAKMNLNALDNFVAQLNLHTHLPSAIKYERAKFRTNIKERATTKRLPNKFSAQKCRILTPLLLLIVISLSNFLRCIRHQRPSNHVKARLYFGTVSNIEINCYW